MQKADVQIIQNYLYNKLVHLLAFSIDAHDIAHTAKRQLYSPLKYQY